MFIIFFQIIKRLRGVGVEIVERGNILFVIYFYLFMWKYFNLKCITTIMFVLNNIFISFSLVGMSLLTVTEYYLSQQSQHQHLLTS
jgi:hypothetical protein